MQQFCRCLFVLMCVAAAAFAQQDFSLHDGDVVVFFGDSITEGRLYTLYLEDYVITRFCQRKIRFVNSGWGGDSVAGGFGGGIDMRLTRDVLAYRPTAITIMLGMNDAGYRPFDASLLKSYREGYTHILSALQAAVPGIKITAVQPSPFDDFTRPPQFDGGYNNVLVRFGQDARQTALAANASVVDANTPVVAALNQAIALDPGVASQLIPDRIHPSNAASLWIGGAILKSWNAPAVVSSVAIDAVTSAITANNALVNNLLPGAPLEWDQLDFALPLPVDFKNTAVALALRTSDFAQSFDQQMLTITSLRFPSYTLYIDGTPVGSFSSAQLSNGINLALMDTPMWQQASYVNSLTALHNRLHYSAWRDVQVPLQNTSFFRYQNAIDDLTALEDDILTQRQNAACPVAHHYALLPDSKRAPAAP